MGGDNLWIGRRRRRAAVLVRAGLHLDNERSGSTYRGWVCRIGQGEVDGRSLFALR
jgi:hypothetical protein